MWQPVSFPFCTKLYTFITGMRCRISNCICHQTTGRSRPLLQTFKHQDEFSLLTLFSLKTKLWVLYWPSILMWWEEVPWVMVIMKLELFTFCLALSLTCSNQPFSSCHHQGDDMISTSTCMNRMARRLDYKHYQRPYMKDSNIVFSRRKDDLLLGSNNRYQTGL